MSWQCPVTKVGCAQAAILLWCMHVQPHVSCACTAYIMSHDKITCSESDWCIRNENCCVSKPENCSMYIRPSSSPDGYKTIYKCYPKTRQGGWAWSAWSLCMGACGPVYRLANLELGLLLHSIPASSYTMYVSISQLLIPCYIHVLLLYSHEVHTFLGAFSVQATSSCLVDHR